jgi:hypothetical protein
MVVNEVAALQKGLTVLKNIAKIPKRSVNIEFERQPCFC